MNYPFKMFWGSASADFQYEGGFHEGNRGLITHEKICRIYSIMIDI